MKGLSAALAFVLAAAAAPVPNASAFAVPSGGSSRTRTPVALNLLPTQGRQLVAASNAALARWGVRNIRPTEEDTVATASPNEPPLIEVSDVPPPPPPATATTTTATDAARGLVARLFSLPSVVRGAAGAAAALDHPKMTDTADLPLSFDIGGGNRRDGGDDVVLYPVLGYRWVRTEDGREHVLPTTSRASCSIPNLPRTGRRGKGQEVYGWYSRSFCRLGSPHGSDAEYCASPPSSSS